MKIEKANILVVGNSGSGKSTLINAVLDDKVAKESLGHRGTTKIQVFGSDSVPFRLIDTIGLESSPLQQIQVKRSLAKWTKKQIHEENSDSAVSMIWYCVDTMSARLFQENIQTLRSVTRFWKDVPVIVVLTKSYSAPSREEYEELISKQIQRFGKGKIKLEGVISVVAQEMAIDQTTVVPPYGLEKLIDMTIEISPEAIRGAENIIKDYKLNLKRKMAHGFTAAVTAGSALVGASPVPVADAFILVPAQSLMVRGIAKIYDIDSGDTPFINSIIECGSISVAARAAVSLLKGLFPGVGNAINAIVAAVLTGALGEISILLMEKVYKGEIDASDLDFVKKFTETEFAKTIETVLPQLKALENTDLSNVKNVGQFVSTIFKK